MTTLSNNALNVVKWLATGLIIIGAVVAAGGYNPYNYLWSTVGSVFWFYVGVQTEDKPLMTLNAFMASLAVMAYFANGGTI